jgi:peptidyl-prolyl cis-trans isomerase D
MFDLFRRRDKAVRYLLGTLLGLVALSLVITLIPGYGTPSMQSEQVIAEIGGEALTTREVQNTITSSLRGRNVPPEMVQFYVPQVVDQMITERAVAYQAERMGFRISDDELATAIRSMIQQYFPGEVKREDYARFLSQQGLTIDQFERNIRQNLLLLRLQNIALEGAIVTPDEVEQAYRRRGEKVKLEYVRYATPADLRTQVTITPDDARAWFNTQRAQFTIPEKRSFHVLIADEAKVAAGFQVPEQELRAAYSANIDQYRTQERAKVRHILIKTADKPAAEAAGAEAKARDILKQVRAGGDFAELAKKHSEDTGSAVRGGDLDWVTKGQMVPEFEKSAFSLKPNEISDLVKTQFGYHIVQVTEKEEARVKPFEEVRTELAQAQVRESVFNRMQQSLDQARAELQKNIAGAPQIAAKHGLTHYFVEKAGQGDSVPEIGTSPELSANVAGTRAGEVSQSMQVAPTKLAVVAVTDVQAARPAEFAEVENNVRESLVGMKTQQLADQRLKQMTEAFRAAGGDLQAAAKQAGGAPKTTDLFGTEGVAGEIGPASQVAEAFTKPVGSVIGPITVSNQVFLAKVIEKQPADMSKLPAEREDIVLTLKRKKAAERKELFEDGLLTQLIREGKVKKNQDAINRVVQGYRG